MGDGGDRREFYAARHYGYQIFRSCFTIKPFQAQYECLVSDKTRSILEFFSEDVVYHNALDDCFRVLRNADVPLLASCYSRLFEQPGRPPVPYWESYYVTGERILMHQISIEVRKQYLDHGYIPSCVGGVPDDSLGLELAFMEKLAMVCESSIVEQDNDTCQRAVGASQLFLNDHLGTWVSRFAAEVASFDECGPFVQVANLLKEFVSEDELLLR